MNDQINSKVIYYGRKILNKFDMISSSKWKYQKFYEYINSVLENDFKKIDIQFKNKQYEESELKIPFKFWIMWWQGVDNAPELVKNNINRLTSLLGEENIHVITRYNFEDYTNISSGLKFKLKEKKISFTHWSDIVRFNILKNNGGYWIDSTVAMSETFKSFLETEPQKYFFSLSSSKEDYHYISYNQWTTWLVGGIPHLELFEYIDAFYNSYFRYHDKVVDYFLLDDVISHYYVTHSKFRDICMNNQKEWKPYFWSNNFDITFNMEMIYLFEHELNYSVQKMNYKFDQDLLSDSKNLITYLIKNKL